MLGQLSEDLWYDCFFAFASIFLPEVSGNSLEHVDNSPDSCINRELFPLSELITNINQANMPRFWKELHDFNIIQRVDPPATGFDKILFQTDKKPHCGLYSRLLVSSSMTLEMNSRSKLYINIPFYELNCDGDKVEYNPVKIELQAGYAKTQLQFKEKLAKDILNILKND